MNVTDRGWIPLRTNLQAADYAAIVQLGEARGSTGDALAADIIHQWLISYASDLHRRQRRLSDGDLVEIADRTRAGATPEALAFVYGVTPETIRRHLRKLRRVDKTTKVTGEE